MTSRPQRIGTGLGFALGFVATVVTTLLAVAAGATGSHLVAVLLVGAAVVGVSAGTTVPAAVGTALVGWGLLAGFVLGRGGVLVLDAESLRDLLGLVLAAGLAVAVGALVRNPPSLRVPRPGAVEAAPIPAPRAARVA